MSCKDAFQKHVEISVPANFGGENGTLQVPAGKCLIIEYISAEAFMPQGQQALFGIITTVDGIQVRHYLGTHPLGAFGGQDYFWVSRRVKIRADPGSMVTVRADRDVATGTATFRFSIAGRLE